MAPKIIIYEASAEDAAPHNRFMGRIHLGDAGFHPVVIVGNSREGTLRKTQEWWAAEIAKAEAKKPVGRPAKPAAPAPEPAVYDPGDVV